ncbi:TPM domain-containing protein [Microbacterium lacus]|uniref:TPM domain-containing protein n=1 Tax=Microbacterium lacus TaxID=415217 RepID=UPI00384DA1B0
MRAGWAVSLTAVVTLMLATLAGGASATDPVSLGSQYVVDEVGALSDAQATAAESRLESLYESTGVDLYVVIVDAFTNPTNSQDWADAVAESNGLGPTQYLLAIASESRQFYISADSTGPLSESEVAGIEAAIKPQLSSGDYAGAIDTAASGFQSAQSSSGMSGGGFFPGIFVFVLIAAGVAFLIWMFMRRRKKAQAGQVGGSAEQQPALSIEELQTQASSALVQTDDAVKTSEQELGFARAQFGDAATVEFGQALEKAKSNLTEAFTLKQQLDDHVEDSEADTRAWNEKIVQLCAEANAGLDEKAAAFDELRKLEQNAPEALARVHDERQKVGAALADAGTHLQTLGTSYAPEALATIADNPEQATQRLSFADEQLALAETLIGAGKGGEAAVSIRAAEEAVGQADLLEKAIDKLGADLAAGEKDAAALIAELESDVAVASALPDADGALTPVIASTTQQIATARGYLSGNQRRPLFALQGLTAANDQIDSIVQGMRDAQAQRQRASQMLGQVMLQAQGQVSAAEDYITSRRGAIGAEARTRLAEAGSSLVQAQQLQASDPEAAMQWAQRANQLAGQAIQHAQNDVNAFGGGAQMGGGSSGGSGNMMGAILGGIVINSLLGGGGGGRSSGGSMGGLGGMFGGGGGGFSPGSFGGGGTRGRRGGGRF